MMDIVWNLSYIIAVVIVMFVLNVRLALLFLIIIPIAVWVITYFGKKYMKLNRKIREINSRITGDFNEGITGIRSIKTMAIEEVIDTDFRKDTSDMKRTSVHAMHYGAILATLVTGIGSITLAIVLWQGGLLTKQMAMEIGTLSVFISYAVGIMDPIEMLVETISGVIAIQVNIERFTRLMNTESDVADGPEVVERYGDTFHPK